MHAQAIAVSGWNWEELAATVIGTMGLGFLLSSVKPPIMQHGIPFIALTHYQEGRSAGGESPQLEWVVCPDGVWSEAFVGNELKSRKAVHLFERGKGGGQLDVWL